VVASGTTKNLRGALAFVDAAQAASVKLPRAYPSQGCHRWRTPAQRHFMAMPSTINAEILAAI
jgi:hypothetical protein